jgi:1-acyl-sn-glycerol-3-phosphate acyltransferase
MVDTMIQANRTWLGVKFFDLYASVQLNRYFNSVEFDGAFIDLGKPVLMIANHFSWWDGFIQMKLNKQRLKRLFHVMMLEEQLRKHMILNKCGAFSIKKNDRSVIDSLNYSVHLLHNPQNLVLLFPQGEIQSLYTRPYVFEHGLYYILKRLGENVQVVFNINLVDYNSQKKPSLTIYYRSYPFVDKQCVQAMERDFNEYANTCIKKQTLK